MIPRSNFMNLRYFPTGPGFRRREIECTEGAPAAAQVTLTNVAGTGAITQNAAGYWAMVTTGTDADETQCQFTAAPWYLNQKGKELLFMTQFKRVDGGTGGILSSHGIGLSVIDTTMYAARSDSILIKQATTSANLILEVYAGSALKLSKVIGTLADVASWHWLAILITQDPNSYSLGRVQVFLDGAQIADEPNVVLPAETVNLHESWYSKAGEGAVKGLNFRRIYTLQEEAY